MRFLTVTLNSAVDRVIFIDEFKPESVMRTTRYVTSVGGKGFDTSVVLRHLGADTLAVGFMAGENGRVLQALLENYGIRHDLVWVGGETRIAHVIAETARNRISHVIVGALEIEPSHADALLERIRAGLPGSAWVIGAGSIPPVVRPSLWAEVVRIARAAGVPTLIDSSGPPVFQAVEAGLDILKMNRDEFYSTFSLLPSSWDELVQAARSAAAQLGIRHLIVTCGADGILAFTPEGDFHAVAPLQAAVNAAGAGDAVSAALAWRLAQADEWRDALRWGAAVSAAVVLTEGTADCPIEDVQRLLPQVRVTPLG